MGLFAKKEERIYFVLDGYSDDVVAVCATKELKQINQVQPKAKYIVCTEYEAFKFNEHQIVPDDLLSRPSQSFKDLK